MRYAGHSSIAVAIGTFGLCIAAPAHGQTIGQTIEIRSVGEFESVFERYRYTSKAWHTGVHEVPRLYLAEVPTYWRDTYSKRVPISEKKSLFFRLLAPVSLYVNEHILGDLRALKPCSRARQRGKYLPPRIASGSRILRAYTKCLGPTQGRSTPPRAPS
jgi:hypothetical protein